jgi:hypothetical protein
MHQKKLVRVINYLKASNTYQMGPKSPGSHKTIVSGVNCICLVRSRAVGEGVEQRLLQRRLWLLADPLLLGSGSGVESRFLCIMCVFVCSLGWIYSL